MKRITPSVAIVALVLAAGAGGAWIYLKGDRAAGPASAGDQAGAQALCAAHGIPAAVCPFCDPSLIERLGHCAGHDVPEALCTRCNPVLIPAFKVEGDWCAGHEVPESQCVLCNPALAAAAAGQQPLASAAGEESDRTLRWRRAPSADCPKTLSAVTLASADVTRAAGLAFDTVVERPVRETISCNAEVAFDGDRFARIAPRAAGVISGVLRDLGDRVEPGDVLATIESVELGTARAEYLQARALTGVREKDYAREKTLEEKHVSTEADVLAAEGRLVEARIALAGAEQKLRNLGLTDDAIAAVAAGSDTSSHLAVIAPFAGTVVQRDAVIGEAADPLRPTFAIADTSIMWAWLDLYEADVARVQPGQPVELRVEGLGGESFAGTVNWVSAHVDPRTRTIKVRTTVDNPQGRLRANMFGSAGIMVHEHERAIVIPKSAVQWDGCCNIVFVRRTDTVFQPFKVTLGSEMDGSFVVEKGLAAGETIVTEGSFLLKTEILKGNIGAGCCELDPGANRKSGT